MANQSHSIAKSKGGQNIRTIAMILSGGVLSIGFILTYVGYFTNGTPTAKTFEGMRNHLGSKTPFHPDSSELLIPNGCTPKMIWLLVRHGTRNPDEEAIKNMISILPGLQQEILGAGKNGLLDKLELEELQSWKLSPMMNLSAGSWLVGQGYKDMEAAGKRFSKKFPQLFPKHFSNETYLLWSSPTQRTIESRKAFAKAIFGSNEGAYFPGPIVGDPLLQYFKTCQKYIQEVCNDPEALAECRKFEKSAHFGRMLEKLRLHIGLERNVTALETFTMHTACVMEWAQNPLASPPPWCVVFDESVFKVLEYYTDMKSYWQFGYGYPVTSEQSCTLIQDVVQRMRNARKNGSVGPSTVVYFGHNENLFTLISRLGLFQDDEPLTSDNFEKLQRHREWRTSVVGKFASNLAFVLLHCPKKSNPYQVSTFFQERPTEMPACSNQWMCPLDTFLSNLKPIADNCDLGQICKV